MHAIVYTRERKNIGSTWSFITCLFPLVVAQSFALQDPEGYCRSYRLNNSDRKQATQAINNAVHQTVPKYSTDGSKRFYTSLRTCEHMNRLNQSYD
jgi:hypothetical protein